MIRGLLRLADTRIRNDGVGAICAIHFRNDDRIFRAFVARFCGKSLQNFIFRTNLKILYKKSKNFIVKCDI